MNEKLKQQVKALFVEAAANFEEFFLHSEKAGRNVEKIITNWVENEVSDYYSRLCDLVGFEKAAELDAEFLKSLKEEYGDYFPGLR